MYVPEASSDFSYNLHFRFKGMILQNEKVFSRIGVGMEGPNENIDLSPKFGMESDINGQFSNIVRIDGISRTTLSLGIMVPVTCEDENCESRSKEYYFLLTNDRLIFCHPDGITAEITSSLPNPLDIKKGISVGLQTLNPEEKILQVKRAAIYS